MADESLTPEQIAEAALNPQEFSGDGQTTKERPIKDAIDALTFQRSNKRGARRFKSIRMSSMDGMGQID